MHAEYALSSIDVNSLGSLTNYNGSCSVGYMDFGERLRAARKYAKLTQQELATTSGVPQQTISKIERGDQDTSSHTVHLAVACGVRPQWLAMEEGPMTDTYVTDQPRQKAMMILQEMPDYAVDDAIKGLATIVELTKKAADEAKK